VSGYSGFLKKQQTQAQNFLSSGNLNYNPLNVVGSNSTGCQDSTDCASGWACVGGICVQETSGSSPSGSGNMSGCGNGGSGGSGVGGVPGECGSGPVNYLLMDEELAEVYEEAVNNLRPGDVLLKEGLNGGTVGNGLIGVSLNGKCLKTGCSGTSTSKGTNDVCCGQGRCCRMGSYVQCYCGNCPPPPERCSKFCTSYLAANGKPGVGCTDDNTCDECSYCADLGNFQGTACKKKIGGAPCWCENGGCSYQCDKCGDDGACTTDCENCQTCYTTYKYCDSGPVKLECCYSACDYSSGFSTCRDSYECPDPLGGDPCAGSCYGQTFCDGPPPPCPDGASCTDNGSITAGGGTCYIRTVCDKSNVPESCKECDCNCDNDCPDCFVCSSGCACEPDPRCE
jgi:hypothetical protein